MKKQEGRGGLGFLSLLAILFIGLKLTGHIAWSWWWVTAPLWGAAALALGIVVVVVLASAIIATAKALKK